MQPRNIPYSERTILVVDDVPLMRSIATSILKTEGYTVLTASAGQECIDLHKGPGAIALTILDFEMPGLNGLETFAELKKVKPDVRVILSSGAISPAEERQMLKMGVRAVVEKPYSAGILLRAVSSVLAA